MLFRNQYKGHLMTRLILITAFFLHIATYSFSKGGGGSTFEFLNLPGSTRVATMGGNVVSHYDNDINFVLNNPALLRPEMDRQLALNYINYVSDINFGYVAYAQEFDGLGIIGAGLQYINYGHFYNTDETGEILGSFYPSEYSFNLYYSAKVHEKINFGMAIKTIYSSFYTHFSSGIAADLGLVYFDESNLFSAGLVVKNIGTQIKPYTEGNFEPLPFDIQLGFTKGLEHAPFRFSVTFHNLLNWDLAYESIFDQQFGFGRDGEDGNFFNRMEEVADEFMRHVILGVELTPFNSFYVSMGYNYRRRAELTLSTMPRLVGMSIGAGLRLERINLSYGVASYHLAGTSNHISLGVNLGAFYRSAN